MNVMSGIVSTARRRPRVAALGLMVAITVGLVAGLTGVATASRDPGPRLAPGRAIPTSAYCAEPEELAFLALINQHRAQNGLGPLTLTQTLGAAAEHHSL